jgi:flavin-dependent dehydrogenase
MLDIVVAGAGPAGCRAAELLAQRGLSVLLLDPKAPWEKPCGGGLTAAALRNTPELEELRPDGQLVTELQLIAPSGASIVTPLGSPYLVVSRLSLSEWGIDRAVRAGAKFRRVGLRNARPDDDRWVVTDTDGTHHPCGWLVAADGAASRLRRVLAPTLQPGRCVARVTYPEHANPSHRAVLRFLPSVEGYTWDFPRVGHHSLGVVVPAGDMRRVELDRIVEELEISLGLRPVGEHRGAVIATWDWTAGYFSELGGAMYAVLGDAAGLADPVSGEGIDYALRSGRFAAEVFEETAGFRRYPGVIYRTFARDRRRSRNVSRYFYRPRVVETLVRAARRSPAVAALLARLVNAVNEHEPVGPTVRRTEMSGTPHRTAGSGQAGSPKPTRMWHTRPCTSHRHQRSAQLW